MIVAEQLIHVLWGPDLLPLPRPEALRGSLLFGDVALEKFRLAAVVVGLGVFAALAIVLNRTKIGLLIRAGVEHGEMVEAMGYRIQRLFVSVIARILPADLLRRRFLGFLLVIICLSLALAAVLSPGARSLDVAARICVFVLLVASYDLLLGYTGIVSFAHTMFFGIGGYGIGIALARVGTSWGAIGIGVLAALAVSAVLSFVIGLFSLRVRAI